MESLPPKLYRRDIALFVYDDNWDLLESKSRTRHKKSTLKIIIDIIHGKN